MFILIADLFDGVFRGIKKRPWIAGFALAGGVLLITCVTAARDQEKETMIGEKVQAADVDIYGCDMIGEYDYPFNTMSQDWSAGEVEGFYYHDITEECTAAGGTFPVIAQVYTYCICQEYGVDYEMVFALIERESKCRWDAVGDDGESKGYMQVMEKWHTDRMERIGAGNLLNPFQNVRVGVDFLAELQEKLADVPEEDRDYYVLAAYNYGMQGAKTHLWSKGIVKYDYNEEIMNRAAQLKEETRKAREGQ